jgi:hypothetical protein
MPFEVGEYIKMNNNDGTYNDETYLVKNVEVIRLPAEPETPDVQGDIDRYHYTIKPIIGNEKVIEIIEKKEPNNNVDIEGVTWNKYEQRGGNRKSKRRRHSKRRRGTKRRRQTKGKKRRQ